MGKTKKDTTERPKSRVDRRLFIQGMGVAAAATVTGFSNRAVVANTMTAPAPSGSGILRRSPVVMIWRRISDLYETKAFVKKTLGLPVIGQDPISIMYDAGGAILGYSVHEVPAGGEAIAELCSDPGLQAYSLQNNPATSLIFAPTDFRSSAENLFTARGLVTPPSRTDIGDTLTFLDDDGNYSCFCKQTGAANGIAGVKLDALSTASKQPEIRKASFDQSQSAHAKQPNIPNPILGIDLMVSNLEKSKKFYTEVLGLTPLKAAVNEARFDVGPLILTLRVEPSNMLVQFLKKTGRLVGDWFVFHVTDIKATTKALVRQGIKFPSGIETSTIGEVAYFNDPDGYSLVLWKPSGMTKMIDFKPVLQRILTKTERAWI